MKRIKEITMFCICGMFLCGIPAEAQTTVSSKESPPLSVHVRMKAKHQVYLKVQFELDLDSLRLKKKQARVLTPVLSDGTNRIALRSVKVNGTWRHWMDLRNKKESDALVVHYGKRGAGRVEYVDSCLYRPWMKNAKLWLAEDLCGCGDDPMEQSLRLLSVKVDAMEAENGKERDKELINKGKATRSPGQSQETAVCKVARVTLFLDFLQFPVNRTDILPGFRNNRAELRKLTQTLDSLLALPQARIELVDLTGYASPEGPYNNNEHLAYGRTVALREHLQKVKSYRELPFRTASVAEDWEGLKKALQDSAMPYREELLMIMATNLLPDEKEDRIRFLDEGKAYGILKRDFLPQLRRTVCEIHYQVHE